MKLMKGKVVEIPYTPRVSSAVIKRKLKSN